MKFFRPEFFGSTIFDSQNFSTVFSETGACPSEAKPVVAVVSGRRDIISSPVAVYYELTRRCNLHCQQCFASCRTADPSELPSETVFAVLRQLAAAKEHSRGDHRLMPNTHMKLAQTLTGVSKEAYFLHQTQYAL